MAHPSLCFFFDWTLDRGGGREGDRAGSQPNNRPNYVKSIACCLKKKRAEERKDRVRESGGDLKKGRSVPLCWGGGIRTTPNNKNVSRVIGIKDIFIVRTHFHRNAILKRRGRYDRL